MIYLISEHKATFKNCKFGLFISPPCSSSRGDLHARLSPFEEGHGGETKNKKSSKLSFAKRSKLFYQVYLIFILTAVLACNNNPSKNTKNNNPETINKTDENKATKKTEKKEDKKIYNVADETPYFSECKDIECSKAAINQFISEHLKYPAIAKEDGIEGVVLLSFIINKNGSIQDIKILKDIGSGCGKEAMRVVQLMEKKEVLWTPGKKQGKPVRFKYHLPVRFKLY